MKPLRIHFSCGAASGVSLLLASRMGAPVDAVYADTGGEHTDNMRFLHDMEKLTGITVPVVRSEKYSSPLDVWRKRSDSELEADLIVPLASATVRERIGAHAAGDLDLASRNEGPGH